MLVSSHQWQVLCSNAGELPGITQVLLYVTSVVDSFLPLRSVLDLDAFERCNKAEGLGTTDEHSQVKNLQDAETTQKLFRFLQLLCEGHNLGMTFLCLLKRKES